MTTHLQILTVPAFNDNYFWLIHDKQSAAVVDPGDAEPVLRALAQHQLSLSAILLTHHHADHIGGVNGLLAHFPVPVFGPAHDNIACVTAPLEEDDVCQLPELGLELQTIAVPGHTLGHIAYFANHPNWLFCGDTLFAGGCGRLFEGSPAQMLHSLDKLATLPDDTLVYCAHEYTLSNLRFALAVEPENRQLQARMQIEQEKRNQSLPTVPSNILLEKQTNPFLRVREASVLQSLLSAGKIDKASDAISRFAALREWKNNFR